MKYNVSEFTKLKLFIAMDCYDNLQEYLNRVENINILAEDGILFETAISNSYDKSLEFLLDYATKLIAKYPEAQENLEEILIRSEDLYEPSSTQIVALIKPYVDSANEQNLTGYEDIFYHDESSESLQDRSGSGSSELLGNTEEV